MRRFVQIREPKWWFIRALLQSDGLVDFFTAKVDVAGSHFHVKNIGRASDG